MTLYTLARQAREQLSLPAEAAESSENTEESLAELNRSEALRSLLSQITRISTMYQTALARLNTSFDMLGQVFERHHARLHELSGLTPVLDQFSSPALPGYLQALAAFTHSGPLIQQNVRSPLEFDPSIRLTTLGTLNGQLLDSWIRRQAEATATVTTPRAAAGEDGAQAVNADGNVDEAKHKQGEDGLVEHTELVQEMRSENQKLSAMLQKWAVQHVEQSCSRMSEVAIAFENIRKAEATFAKEQRQLMAQARQPIIPIIRLPDGSDSASSTDVLMGGPAMHPLGSTSNHNNNSSSTSSSSVMAMMPIASSSSGGSTGGSPSSSSNNAGGSSGNISSGGVSAGLDVRFAASVGGTSGGGGGGGGMSSSSSTSSSGSSGLMDGGVASGIGGAPGEMLSGAGTDAEATWQPVSSFIRKKPSLSRNASVIRLGSVERTEKRPLFQELVDKEKVYIFGLLSLVRVFLIPLRQRLSSPKGIEGVTMDDADVIFGNVEQIYRMHELNLRSLERCLRNWKTSPAGSVFFGAVRGLDVYRAYIYNQFFAFDRLALCTSQSRVFREFVKTQEASIVEGEHSLATYLQTPIEHLRYLLSFAQRMTKVVGDRDGDYEYFKRSRKAIKMQLAEIAVQKQKPLDVMELMDIRDRLVGWSGPPILSPGRKFHRSYDLFLLGSDDRHVPHTVIVCSDLVLVVHKKGKRKLVHDCSDVPTAITLASMPDTVTRRHCFTMMSSSMGMRTFLARKQEEKEQLFSDVLYAAGITCVFGKPLSELTRHFVDGVPRVVRVLCDWLRKEGRLKTVGVFRENGNQNHITYLRECFDRTIYTLQQDTNPHNIAGALKLWLRLLPEPLATFPLYDSVVASLDKPEPLRALAAILNTLPPENFHLLKYLLSFFAECAALETANKMSAYNLSIVFAPAILSKKETDQLTLPDKRIFELTTMMISNHEQLFDNSLL